MAVQSLAPPPEPAVSAPVARFRRATARHPLRDAWRAFVVNRGALLGAAFLVLMLAVAFLAPVLAPGDPRDISRDALLSPRPGHPLGTDDLGRDTLRGLLHGSRVSLSVGLLAAATAGIVGAAIGMASGFSGGRIDQVLMRVTELFQVVPQFFLALLVIALWGPGIEKIVLVVGLLSWPSIARLVRVEFIVLRDREFVQAATAIGCGSPRLMFRHILPNALAPAVVACSLAVGRAILTEANLSFFGLGDPGLVSWGGMLNNAQRFLSTAWWLALFPGLAILLTVLAVNLAGDGLNDALNPRLRRR